MSQRRASFSAANINSDDLPDQLSKMSFFEPGSNVESIVARFTGVEAKDIASESLLLIELGALVLAPKKGASLFVQVFRSRGHIWELTAETPVQRNFNASVPSKEPVWQPMILNFDTLAYSQPNRKVKFVLVQYNGSEKAVKVLGQVVSTATDFYTGKVGESRTMVLVDDKGEPQAHLTVAGHPYYLKTTQSYLQHNGLNVRDRNHTTYHKLTNCLARISPIGADLNPRIHENSKLHLEFYRQEVNGKWMLAFKTDDGNDVSDPCWDTFVTSLHGLCFDDLDRPIRIKIKSHHKSNAFFIGEVYTTLRAMIVKRHFEIEAPFTPQDEKTPLDPATHRENAAASKGKTGTLGFKVHLFSVISELPKLAEKCDLSKKVTYTMKTVTEGKPRSKRPHTWSHPHPKTE